MLPTGLKEPVPFSVPVQPGFCQISSETKTQGFTCNKLIYFFQFDLTTQPYGEGVGVRGSLVDHDEAQLIKNCKSTL